METRYGFWGLIILMLWQQIGYMMIIYIAGLQSVPEDMLEAARIDGANRWQTLFRVKASNTFQFKGQARNMKNKSREVFFLFFFF